MAEEKKPNEHADETKKSERNEELRDDQLQKVSGGNKPRTFNPQPDPPG